MDKKISRRSFLGLKVRSRNRRVPFSQQKRLKYKQYEPNLELQVRKNASASPCIIHNSPAIKSICIGSSWERNE